jgi:anthranilate phosphoribosyltransferase
MSDGATLWPDVLGRLVRREDLSPDLAAAALGAVLRGEATDAQIAGFAVGLRAKGETPTELAALVRTMLEHSEHVDLDGPLLDTCGTGGDRAGTVNVSTLAALVAAAAGAPVVKHGNRAASSRCGSADVLEALGVDVDAPVEVVERCLEEIGIGFLFAPSFHGATRHAAAARKEIGVRTIFNLLGPLTNPAGARHQLIGVYDAALVEPMARTLLRLGSEHALVVHGDGLDELSPNGPTDVAELRGGEVKRYQLRPRDFGLADEDRDALAGGDAQFNAAAARAILGGARGAGRSAVVMTAAGALYAAGKSGLRDGARLAERMIDEGAASAMLDRLVEHSRRRP